ncbi:hypothetical protein ES705_28738 [subsurface metagenome]
MNLYLDKNKTKGKKYYRYRVLEKPKDKKNSKNLKTNNDLIDKLVLLMVKAGINSEKYEIDIKESEIESSIKRLTKGGLIG